MKFLSVVKCYANCICQGELAGMFELLLEVFDLRFFPYISLLYQLAVAVEKCNLKLKIKVKSMLKLFIL